MNTNKKTQTKLNCVEERILYKEESYKILGICIKIHNILGKELKEIVYKDAMKLEFIKNNIPYEREKV